MVTPFERRQRILSVLGKQPGIKVHELASVLGVSEGTIRNDLRALNEANQLTRVHGGAVRKEDFPILNRTFAERAQLNTEAKQRIAHRAAELVEDGDVILLDASTTVFHIVPYLQELHNLTIVTNGIETGLALAKNPSHTVILLGGVLRSDGTSVIGHLGEKILADLHIRTAFTSGSGFSIEAGLMETDLQEIQLKSRMIRSAERVVALIDSTKFGRVGLTSFAGLDQIQHIFTDSGIDPQLVDQLCHANISVRVCGESMVTSFVPGCGEIPRYKIGFANLGEEKVPFSVEVRRGLEQAAQNSGNIDLILADNELNGEVALQVADRLIAESIDLAIEYQIDEKTGNMIINHFKQVGIPVIAVDIPMVGATFFGVDNYRAGYLAGVALGEWIAKHWHGKPDHLVVLEEPRPGALPAARIQGQLDGLQEMVGVIDPACITRLDSSNISQASERQMLQLLKGFSHRQNLAVISFNDEAALGALNAARKARWEEQVVIVGQGGERLLRKEIRQPHSRIIGSTAYWPEKYGEKLVEVALRLLKGEPVPPAVYINHVFLDQKNIDLYYPEERI
jgi:ribose transport system substrate-binding protein